MVYNPEKHHRRSIRLPGYDYSKWGWYFVTIIVQNREMLYGYIENKKMILNDFGRIVKYHWQELPRHFKNTELDDFQVMPNHLHGVIRIVGDNVGVGAMHSYTDLDIYGHDFDGNASPLHPPRGTKPGSLGAIMQNYQSVTSRKINRIRRTPGARLWQRNYWDHIIRDQNELNRIRNYIRNNPANWDNGRGDIGV